MKIVAKLLLMLTATQVSMQPGVREPFRKVTQRAIFAILRLDFTDDESFKEANKAVEEMKIESSSLQENEVFKLIVEFQANVNMNAAQSSIIGSQLKMDEIYQRPDIEMQYKAAEADRKEMSAREIACSKAIEDMLRDKLSTNIPPCKNVQLTKTELKTKLDRIQ